MPYYLEDTVNKTARRQWAELNVEGAPTTTELRQALVTFDSWDQSVAITDCEEWNHWCCKDNGHHELDLDDWYGGIEDAIAERAKYE